MQSRSHRKALHLLCDCGLGKKVSDTSSITKPIVAATKEDGMARTVVGSAVVVREKYYWPDAQLNVWTIVMLATAGTILGVFAEFMMIQSQMRLGTPWYVFSSVPLQPWLHTS